MTHRPDLAVQIAPGPVAIEVELQRKTARRLRGICAMYARLSDDDGPLAGVIYVTDRTDVAELVARVADDVGLWNRPSASARCATSRHRPTRPSALG